MVTEVTPQQAHGLPGSYGFSWSHWVITTWLRQIKLQYFALSKYFAWKEGNMITRNFLAWATLPINIYQSSPYHCTTSPPKFSQLCTYGSPRTHLHEEESSFADLTRSSCSYSTNRGFHFPLSTPPADNVGHCACNSVPQNTKLPYRSQASIFLFEFLAVRYCKDIV